MLLPLALSTSAVLLLGSASIHTLSLQGHLRLQAAERRSEAADWLRSAAQAFAAAASGAEACLLPWPMQAWEGGVVGCTAADPARLRSGVLAERRWTLRDWQPSGDTGLLHLQLDDGRRAAFRLSLNPEGPLVLGISEPQLQGRATGEVAS